MSVALWPASWRTQRSSFCWGNEWSWSSFDTTEAVYSAITMCTAVPKALNTLSHIILTLTAGGLPLVSSFPRGNNRGLKRQNSLQPPRKRLSHPVHTTHPPAAKPPVAQSLTTELRMETVIARFLTGTKAHSPPITDFITLETGGLGRQKIADCWSLPFQKEASWGERRDCQPLWLTWSYHLSNFWLSVLIQSVCHPDSKTRPRTN